MSVVCVYVCVLNVEARGLSIFLYCSLSPPSAPDRISPWVQSSLTGLDWLPPSSRDRFAQGYRLNINTLCFLHEGWRSKLSLHVCRAGTLYLPPPVPSCLCSTKKTKYFSVYSIGGAPMQQQVMRPLSTSHTHSPVLVNTASLIQTIINPFGQWNSPPNW